MPFAAISGYLGTGKSLSFVRTHNMATQLSQFDSHPNDIAITQTEFIPDGLFFLDFSRPLKHLRWFGITNEWFGFTVCLAVPVIHQNEKEGGFVVGVHRSDPYFSN